MALVRNSNKSITEENEYLNIYVKKGYVPFEIDAASRTMDYAYDDYY